MTAWTCLCLAVLGEGRALALPTSGYYSLDGFASEILERFGVEVRRYDARDRASFRRACEGAALAIIETPSNPLLTLTDIAQAAARCARRRRAPVLRQHVRDAAPAAPARPRRRPRLAERDEVPRRATPTCSPA